jgi:hypothetical protein
MLRIIGQGGINSNERNYVRRGDLSFERQLSAELRAELDEEVPSQTYRLREVPFTFLRPAPPRVVQHETKKVGARDTRTHPPYKAAVMPPSAPPQSAPQSGIRTWRWVLAMLVAIPILSSHLPPRPSRLPWVWVETRRALPAVSRVLPVNGETLPPLSTPGLWRSMRMPDGQLVAINYQGRLPSTAALPPEGRLLGEQWFVGHTPWIWMTRPGASFPSWVDP